MSDHMRDLRIVLVSVAMCVILGIPLGTFFFGVLGGVPSLVLRQDIAGVPFLAYAFITVGPLGTIAGLAGGLLVVALVRAKQWNSQWPGWALVGAGAGALLACAIPLLLSVAGWSSEEGSLVPMFGLFATTGALCGALLGGYGWLERQARNGHDLAGRTR